MDKDVILKNEPKGENYIWMENGDAVIYIWVQDKTLNIRIYIVKNNQTISVHIGADAVPQVLDFINKELKRTDEPEILKWRTWKLDLPVRARNCLRNASIETVRDLVKIKDGKELLRLRNFGKLSLTEITEWLTKHNLHFGMDV